MLSETDSLSELTKLVLENSDATCMMLRRRLATNMGCSVILFGATEKETRKVADSIDHKLKVIETSKDGGWFIYTQAQYTCPPLLLSVADTLPPFNFDWDSGARIEIRD